MKSKICHFGMTIFLVSVLCVSCTTPVVLTSWKNPASDKRVSRIAVIALFDNPEYIRLFEDELATGFKGQGLKCIESHNFLSPSVKYTNSELQKKLDSLGTDGALVISYKGNDISLDFNSGYSGGYHSKWGGTGDGWSTTSTVSLRAQLFGTSNELLLWSCDLTLTDPGNVKASADYVAKAIYSDWQKDLLISNINKAGPN